MRLRSHRLFFTLLFVSFLCAFAFPANVTDSVRGNFRAIFAPVAWPAHAIALRFKGQVSPVRLPDEGTADPGHPRDTQKILLENAELRRQVANLTGQIDRLNQREA